VQTQFGWHVILLNEERAQEEPPGLRSKCRAELDRRPAPARVIEEAHAGTQRSGGGSIARPELEIDAGGHPRYRDLAWLSKTDSTEAIMADGQKREAEAENRGQDF
jgi:hypothetical protein